MDYFYRLFNSVKISVPVMRSIFLKHYKPAFMFRQL